MQKGYKHSDEAKERMRLAALTRDNRPRLAAIPTGKNHWNWSEKPTVAALHYRIRTKYGKASSHKCVDCERNAADWSNDGEYTDNIDNYKPRCRSCHVKKDKNWLKK